MLFRSPGVAELGFERGEMLSGVGWREREAGGSGRGEMLGEGWRGCEGRCERGRGTGGWGGGLRGETLAEGASAVK